MRPTTVISVRGRDRAELLADPNFVYVGRRVGRGRTYGWPASDWGNPFRPGTTMFEAHSLVSHWKETVVIDRDISFHTHMKSLVDLYREWILACPALRTRLHELRGKTLGCWCGTWKPGDPPLACHARVLAELADGPMGMLTPAIEEAAKACREAVDVLREYRETMGLPDEKSAD